MRTELEGQEAKSERIRFSRTCLPFRWKTSSPAGPRSFFRQWLIAHMELPFALCVQRSPLWSVSKPRTVNQKARVLLCRNDQRARAWPGIPIRGRQVVPGPLEFEHSMNTRAESEGASLSSVYATDFLICLVLLFYFFIILFSIVDRQQKLNNWKIFANWFKDYQYHNLLTLFASKIKFYTSLQFSHLFSFRYSCEIIIGSRVWKVS